MDSIRVIERSEHNISRQTFSKPAVKVMYRLRAEGYAAYLVGGALRDLLRGQTPRDFDVVTTASIPEIRKLFRNSKTIGKRFPIVHTYFGDDLIEVSSLKAEGNLSDLELVKQDAERRDFTVNAIYYDIEDFKIIDPLGAMEHIEQGLVVPIGSPFERLKEDPVRMLRALKLVVKCGFTLSPELIEAIRVTRDHARDLGAGRKYEEMTRVFLDDSVKSLLEKMQEFGLISYFWPAGSLLVYEKEPKFFAHIRDTLPIHLSRGSFSKHSHTCLWLRLFVEAGVFRPTKNPPQVSKRQFVNFIEPLGMPFRGPVVDTLHEITLMHQPAGKPIPGVRLSNEVRKLLDYYVQHCEPGLRLQYKQLLRKAVPSGKSRGGRDAGEAREERPRSRSRGGRRVRRKRPPAGG